MQTLYTVEDKETGGIKTELHVTAYTTIGLIVVIYVSDEYGTHKKTIRRTFLNTIEYVYHMNLRKKVKKEGGIIHARVSNTPLPKSIQKTVIYPNRDSRGRFIKLKK